MKKQILKVLIVSDYYYPHWTGICKSIYNLTQSVKGPINFTVLTVKFKKTLKNEEVVDGVRILREPYLFSISRAKYSFSLILRFISLVKNYNIVFINSPFSNILPVSIITKLFKKKLLIFHHGDLMLPEGLVNRIIERIFYLCSTAGFFLADKVSTYTYDYALHSRLLKSHLKKFTPLLIPVIVENNKRFNLYDNRIYKKLSRYKKNKKNLFGFAGRFVKEKGVDLLFKAIPKIMIKLPSAHFIFAGEIHVGYENFFKKNIDKYNHAKKNITILGLLNQKNLNVFYKMIDFMIVPSRSDCFNLVQAEAMLYKKPVVISNIPGARFLVKKTGYGILFEKENIKDLVNKVVSMTKFKAYNNFSEIKKLLNNKKDLLNFFYS